MYIRFIADEMLGRLAKWLRILGFDTLYYSGVNDDFIVSIAQSEKRILLTRDTRIRVPVDVQLVFIKSDFVEEQIRQVLDELDLRLEKRLKPRCLICNKALEEVKKVSIKDKVPPYVYETQEKFAQCSECGRIFWHGTHWEKIQLKVEEVCNDYLIIKGEGNDF